MTYGLTDEQKRAIEDREAMEKLTNAQYHASWQIQLAGVIGWQWSRMQ